MAKRRELPTVLTGDMTRHYVADGGTECPFCGSDDIEGSTVQVDGATAWQDITCPSCGAEWRDIFSLSGVELRSPPDQS